MDTKKSNIDELFETQIERERLESTIASRAKIYNVINFILELVGSVSCATGIIIVFIAAASWGYIMNLTLFLTMLVILPIVLVASIIVYISEALWKRKLKKYGLSVPIKRD